MSEGIILGKYDLKVSFPRDFCRFLGQHCFVCPRRQPSCFDFSAQAEEKK